jgi:hypothetical protein
MSQTFDTLQKTTSVQFIAHVIIAIIFIDIIFLDNVYEGVEQ